MHIAAYNPCHYALLVRHPCPSVRIHIIWKKVITQTEIRYWSQMVLRQTDVLLGTPWSGSSEP